MGSSGTCMLQRWIGMTAAQRFRAEQASALWPAAFSCLVAWHVLSGAFRGRGVDRHMLLAGSHTRKDAQESQAPARLTCVCAALNKVAAVVLLVRKEGVTSFLHSEAVVRHSSLTSLFVVARGVYSVA